MFTSVCIYVEILLTKANYFELFILPKLTCVWIGFSGDDDEIPQELLLGKHQLNELGSESAKIKAMGIMDKVSH